MSGRGQIATRGGEVVATCRANVQKTLNHVITRLARTCKPCPLARTSWSYVEWYCCSCSALAFMAKQSTQHRTPPPPGYIGRPSSELVSLVDEIWGLASTSTAQAQGAQPRNTTQQKQLREPPILGPSH